MLCVDGSVGLLQGIVLVSKHRFYLYSYAVNFRPIGREVKQ